MAGIRWSPLEEKFLKKYAGKQPVKWIAEQLGRTAGAVHQRAQYVGVEMPRIRIHAEDSKRAFEIHQRKAIARAKRLKGRRVVLYDGTIAEYTGGVTRTHASGPLFKWIPNLKCIFGGHIVKSKKPDSFPRCTECIKAAGSWFAWDATRRTALRYGLRLHKYFEKRDSQKNSDGLVCCAICGIAERGRAGDDLLTTQERRGRQAVLGIDHDHGCCDGNENGCGKCVRGLLCNACNREIVPFAEKIVSGKAVMPPPTVGPGWQILVLAIKYVEHWNQTLAKNKFKKAA